MSMFSSFPFLKVVNAQGKNTGFGGGSRPQSIPGGKDLSGAVVGIINAFLVLAAVVAVIFIIIGGVQYITARGDEQQAETAKKTILYAIIGLIVIGLSAAMVRFVVDGIF